MCSPRSTAVAPASRLLGQYNRIISKKVACIEVADVHAETQDFGSNGRCTTVIPSMHNSDVHAETDKILAFLSYRNLIMLFLECTSSWWVLDMLHSLHESCTNTKWHGIHHRYLRNSRFNLTSSKLLLWPYKSQQKWAKQETEEKALKCNNSLWFSLFWID